MQITIVQAVVISIWIGLVMSRSFLGGATTTLRFTPMMTGLIVGLVFGRVAEAMIITAAIQLIYMGVFSPGGQMPSEPAIAAAIAVPVALLGDMKPEAAIAVAVPVGLLGYYLYQFRFSSTPSLCRNSRINTQKVPTIKCLQYLSFSFRSWWPF